MAEDGQRGGAEDELGARVVQVEAMRRQFQQVPRAETGVVELRLVQELAGRDPERVVEQPVQDRFACDVRARAVGVSRRT